MTLGNHTFSHPDLNTTPLPQYAQDILQGERVTRPLLEQRGQRLAWFRHPFTHTGPTAEVKTELESYLHAHGYQIAPFTMETADYAFAAVYERAILKNDSSTADKVMRAYLDHQDRIAEWADALARDTFGRTIPQILLVHVNRLNADAMPESLRRLRVLGYTFIALDRAVQDPAYATPDGYVGSSGPSWLHRWRVTLKRPPRLAEEPDPPAWVMQAFTEQ
jgi:peptidoglycan/xylan/chitin deacetylase (PgdA/CDA1 family)